MQSLIRQASNISELLDDSVPFGSKPIQRPSVSPDETTILLFPGQGSQYIGMGESLLDVPGVREMEWCKKQGINEVEAECRIASYLYPDCKVVAGHEVALEFIEKNARDFKLLRCRRLPVSGAFHTDLMKSAAEPVRALMKRIPINPPLVKVYSNLDGHVYHTVKQIQRNTPKLLYKPVKWEQTMHAIYERKSDVPYPTTFECGPGGNLRKILERVNAKAASFMKTFRV
ncbi:unnamed protein product [Darwinula stevensoni]|uniref:Malonyl-CoA:ACP transacylase (MAT) domain-containing protein n=1 Tax=Darwinula stevensoni TaxID=69355 RepID=A0A7R8XFX3_9CRUS|nr:unnamed protein product [Darwinula stevensoni]CAG0895933.1 unnamed protein product [Darwinula stevensoni]